MAPKKTKAKKTKPAGNVILEAIAQVRADLKSDISRVETGLKSDIAQVRTDLKGDMIQVSKDLKGDIVQVRSEMGQMRSDIIKDIAPMFEHINAKFDKRLDTVDHRLSVITKDIHEMKSEIRTAMQVPEAALRQEETIKDHDDRLIKVERDLDVVKTAIKVTNRGV